MKNKNSFLYFVIIALIISLVSCNKKNNANIFYYHETGCLNPWDDYYAADTFSYEALSQTINNFLITENIEVNSIEFDFDSTIIELCYACHCKTGRIIVASVSSGNKQKMKKLSFYQ